MQLLSFMILKSAASEFLVITMTVYKASLVEEKYF
jgi:hypothetical protein